MRSVPVVETLGHPRPPCEVRRIVNAVRKQFIEVPMGKHPPQVLSLHAKRQIYRDEDRDKSQIDKFPNLLTWSIRHNCIPSPKPAFWVTLSCHQSCSGTSKPPVINTSWAGIRSLLQQSHKDVFVIIPAGCPDEEWKTDRFRLVASTIRRYAVRTRGFPFSSIMTICPIASPTA